MGKPGSKLRGALARWCGWRAVVLLSLLGGAASLLGLGGGQWWIFDLCNHFQAQYFGFQTLCLVGLSGMRRFRWALLPAALLVLPGWYLAPYFLPHAAAPPLVRPLRVVSFNVLFTNTRYADTVRWVQQSDPDIAFFPEVTPHWADGLAPLQASMPHSIIHAATHNFGFALFSKHPILHHELVPSRILGITMVLVTLEIGGQQMVFVGMHPPSPQSADCSQARDDTFTELARRLRMETRPVIVAGDFNATPWSHATRPLLEAGLRDSMLGCGFSATWLHDVPLLAIPIDRILVGGPIFPHARWTGPDLGSDHRPVVADLRW